MSAKNRKEVPYGMRRTKRRKVRAVVLNPARAPIICSMTDKELWTLPRTAADYDAMVGQMAKAQIQLAYANAQEQCAGSLTHGATHPSKLSKDDVEYYRSYVRVSLRAIGITRPKEDGK